MKNNRAISKVLSAVLILLTAVFLMLPGALQVSAYSSTYTDDDFTLEIPDEWYQGYNTAWGDVNGNSVNVNITSAPGFYTYDQIYSQEMLDELEKMMENDMEEYKEDIKEQMQSTYGEVMSEEDISDFVFAYTEDARQRHQNIFETISEEGALTDQIKADIDSSYVEFKEKFLAEHTEYLEED